MGLTPRLLFSPCTRPIYFFATESRALFSNPVKYRTVPKTTNANWERLCKVIEHSGLSVNAFARAIGLSCGETLYQIRRGNNGISPNVAKRIHEKYPDFSLAWLMFGCGESLSEVSGSGPDSVARIPVYRTLPERLFRGEPDDFLILSAASAAGAEFRRALRGRSTESVSEKFIAVAPATKRRNPLRQYPSGRNRTLPAVPHSATRAGSVCPFNGFAGNRFAGLRFARSHFAGFRVV